MKTLHHAVRALAAVLICACGGAPGSGDGTEDGKVAPPSERPLTVAFDAGDVTVGFSLGQLRARVSLPSYRVTKHPITREEFDACVDAGACMAAQSFACTDDAMKQLDGFTFDAKSAPAVCAGLS